jgi:hypothetical protein
MSLLFGHGLCSLDFILALQLSRGDYILAFYVAKIITIRLRLANKSTTKVLD